MANVSEAVRRETLWVAAWTLGLAVVTQIVFIIIGRWGWDVLLGSVFGCAVAIGCFFWLGMTVQKAVGRPEAEAKQIFQSSHAMRFLVQGAALAAGFAVTWLNGWAVLVPILSPQIAVRLRPLWKKGLEDETPEDPSGDGGETVD